MCCSRAFAMAHARPQPVNVEAVLHDEYLAQVQHQQGDVEQPAVQPPQAQPPQAQPPQAQPPLAQPQVCRVSIC